MKIENDTMTFSSGRQVFVSGEFVSLAPDGQLAHGYDGMFEEGEFTPDELIELADYMILKWQAFRLLTIAEIPVDAGQSKDFVGSFAAVNPTVPAAELAVDVVAPSGLFDSGISHGFRAMSFPRAIYTKYEGINPRAGATVSDVRVNHEPVDDFLARLKLLTDDQRMSVFSNFCRHCGSADPACKCMRED